MKPARILIVEENKLVARVIASYLADKGHLVTLKNDLHDALAWLQTPGNQPDLLISNEEISRIDGHYLIRHVRPVRTESYPPIILLAQTDEIGDKIAGFEAGADDYMVQPVNTVELGLRVKALLARTQAWRPATNGL